MIAQQLKSELKSRNMSLNDLADIVDIPFETLRNLYYSKVQNPKLSTIVSICDALDVPVDYMLNRNTFSNEEFDIIKNYRDCGVHGKSFIKTTSQLEAQMAKHQRNCKDKHLILCIVPSAFVDDGYIHTSCSFKQILSPTKNSYLAIEINSNNFAPVYCKYDRIVLENRFPSDGEIAVFLYKNKEFIRIFRQNGNQYILESITGRGSNIELTKMNECVCLGTCIDVIRY